MVAQKKDRLDFRAIMDGQRIVLAKLSQGAIGEENSYLLGSLLAAKISQAAASRQEQTKESRKPFFVYMDEFHNFITPSIASLLSGVRKYGVGLTLAHQDLRQVKSRSEDVASAVLSSAYTRVVFRVGDQDARALADGLSAFEPKDLQNLGIGQAIGRIERAEFDFNLRTAEATPVDPDTARRRKEEIRSQSRAKYAMARADVEASLSKDYASDESGAKDPDSPSHEPDPGPSKPPPKGGPSRPSQPQEPSDEPTESREPSAPPLPGRGGPQHKYLQALLKRSAEDRGFRVNLEKRVLDGAGHIDLALEREGLSIGCEIAVTTPLSHELDNLSKCLAAGFDYAVMVSSDKRLLQAARQQMFAELSDEERDRLRFVTPEQFMAFLDEMEARLKASSKTVRGYKVNVKYRSLSAEDKETRERLLTDVISKSLRRTKKK